MTANADKAARVTLRWKEGGQMMTDSIDAGYAMRLEFGALANTGCRGKHAGRGEELPGGLVQRRRTQTQAQGTAEELMVKPQNSQ